MTQESEIPPVQFANARGARLAWQRWGTGPTVVAIPPTAQNIEAAWGVPIMRRMFDEFGAFTDLIHFDKRGTGASDRRSSKPGIDERVEDLRAVMDSAGIERAILYGASEGGPACLLFAATYPHRVDGLVLHGTGPYTTRQDMVGDELDQWHEGVRNFTARWGTAESHTMDGFAPSKAADEKFRAEFARYERAATTPESLLEMVKISLTVDVSEVLEDIDAPTLVLHATGDRIVPVEWGRLLARQIENATLFEYDSEDHFPFTDLAWMPEFERFVTGTVRPRPVAPKQNRAVHIETLGRFQVVVDGQPVPNRDWGSRRARQLCKRLVAARGWPLRREELCDFLWPDETDEAKLGARLSVQLSAVRRVLGGGVVADRQTVALDLEAVGTDLEHLMAVDGDDRIVSAYTGDFLAGDLDEAWATGVRDEARSRFVAAAQRLLDDASVDREAVARKLIGVDEWNDRAHQCLIKVLVEQGRSSDAARAHAAYAEAMADIGVEVGPLSVRSAEGGGAS